MKGDIKLDCLHAFTLKHDINILALTELNRAWDQLEYKDCLLANSCGWWEASMECVSQQTGCTQGWFPARQDGNHDDEQTISQDNETRRWYIRLRQVVLVATPRKRESFPLNSFNLLAMQSWGTFDNVSTTGQVVFMTGKKCMPARPNSTRSQSTYRTLAIRRRHGDYTCGYQWIHQRRTNSLYIQADGAGRDHYCTTQHPRTEYTQLRENSYWWNLHPNNTKWLQVTLLLAKAFWVTTELFGLTYH